MKSMKVFLVQKEWDDEKGARVNIAGESVPTRLKKIVLGYNTISKANSFCYQMNQECSSCPRRAALHTKYEVIAPPVYIRIVDNVET